MKYTANPYSCATNIARSAPITVDARARQADEKTSTTEVIEENMLGFHTQ